ncbi:MAG: hypothetical protein ACRC0X_06920 [Brevinema sp.]
MEESYLKTPLSTAVLNDLKKGIYHVSSLDKTLFALSKDLFWKRLYTQSDDKKINEEARKGVGLSMNSLESDKIFVATKLGIGSISITYYDHASKYKLKEKSEQILKFIYLYGQYKYNIINKPIFISSTYRTPSSQWREMKNSLENIYDPNSNSFDSYYKAEIDKKYKEIRDSVGKYKPLSETDLIRLDSLMIAWIEKVATAGEFFLHCQKGIQVSDISPTKGAGSDISFIKALEYFRARAKFITSKTDKHPTILFGESFGSHQKEEAHHISFKS